ncbi:secondary thiamine-phosphate synthase enzyme YjbQ [Natranaerobius trueperi]|uniref:Secondary thiamine-phosphate synthase enzyme n=1 Tax=Natranaerobius trueperi TaxID=759412 RepID=A0A226BXR3_9FIRM|nr:secondary thiamine-phosphate synthase enzyme YjbQ [Natranaerobius trueperi]OWZ83572.1 hypothetical protein CDO51_07605 [Natranaerobius trueperi]
MDITLTTSKHIELIDISQEIENFIDSSKMDSETITIFVPHTTAAITVNENCDSDVVNDLETAFKKLVPSIAFSHMEGNSPAHLLSSLVGCSITLPVKNNKLDLGTWQGVFFCEFDGPRTRRVKILV